MVSITNGVAALTNAEIRIELGVGMEYISGSLVGLSGPLPASTSTNANQPIFQVANLPAFAVLRFKFDQTGRCAAYDHKLNSGDFKASISLWAGGVQYPILGDTERSHDVRYGNLSVSNVSTSPLPASIGQTVTREVTITNGGLGSLTALTFAEAFSQGELQFSNFILNPASSNLSLGNGNLNTTGDSVILNLGATELSSITNIGANTSLFETGESFVLKYDITITGCGMDGAIPSRPTAYWGCSQDICQSDAEVATITLPPLEPNLIATITDSVSACYGVGEAPDTIYLNITNTGAGPAHNVYMDMRFYDDDFMGVDMNTVEYNLNGNAWTNFAPSQTFWPLKNTFGCATAFTNANPSLDLRNLFRGTLPMAIPAGGEVRIKFLAYKCCMSGCLDQTIWNRLRGSYSRISTLSCTNQCGTNQVNIRPFSKVREFLTSPTYYAPRTFFEGSGVQYAYIDWANFWINDYPMDNQTGYFELSLKLPDCVDRAGTVNDIEWVNFNNQIIPFNTVISRNDSLFIRWEFRLNAFNRFNARNSQIRIPLQADCSEAPCLDTKLSYAFKLIPSTNCGGCELNLACYEGDLVVNCPGTCEGLNYLDYRMDRVSLGTVDLDDNGCPDDDNFCDGTGFVYFAPMDSSKLRRDKAVDGDTIRSYVKGVVNKTSVQSWPYLYLEDSLDITSLLPISGNLLVKRAGVSYRCAGITGFSTASGFRYDLSLPTINNCLNLPGNSFEDGDSIFFNALYSVSASIPQDFTVFFTKNTGYLSDQGNPGPLFRYVCNEAEGMLGASAIYFDHCCGWQYVWDSCESRNDFRNSRMYIAGGTAGNNFFPYEYRRLAWPQSAAYTLPPGWNLDSARFTMVRTRGAGRATRVLPRAQVLATTTTPNADGSISMDFDFHGPVNQGIWTENGGEIPFSDDGFYPEFQVFISPGCAAVTNWQSQRDGPGSQYNPVMYFQRPDGRIQQSDPRNRNISYVIFNAPELVANSPNQNQRGKNVTIDWDVSLSNLSSRSPADNLWVALASPSGLIGSSILEVRDAQNNLLSPTLFGYYQLGKLGQTSSESIRITADYLSCDIDSLFVLYGWDCGSYPQGPIPEACADTLSLYVTPVRSGVSSAITALRETPMNPANPAMGDWGQDSVSMCTPFPVEVTIISNDVGAIFFPKFTLQNTTNNSSPGLSFVSGSGYVEYPVGSTPQAFSLTADGNLVSQSGGASFVFDLNEIAPATFNANSPIFGIDSVLTNKHQAIIRFELETNCDFGGGDIFKGIATAQSRCGAMARGEQALTVSSSLPISGTVAAYATDIQLSLSDPTINPCGQSSSEIRAVITKIGANNTGFFDEIEFVLPPYVSADIFTTPPTCYSSPTCPSPIVIDNPLPGGGTSITLFLGPTQLGNGDQMDIGLSFSMDDTLACGLAMLPIVVSTKVPANIDCNGVPCPNFKVITGRREADLFIEKPSVVVTRAVANVSCPTASPEVANMTIDVLNIGGVDHVGGNVEIWHDVNANRQVDAADVLAGTVSLNGTLPGNQTRSYSGNITLPQAGAACQLIAIPTGCICDANIAASPVALLYQNAGPDLSLCPGQSAILGCGANGLPGYSYNWTPGADLSSFSVAQPAIQAKNDTNITMSTQYVLTTTRLGGCISRDTVNVTVSPSIANNDTLVSCETNPGQSEFNLTQANASMNGGTGFSVNWFADAALSSPISNPQTHITAPGMVYARITNSNTGCQNIGELSLQLAPAIPQPSLPAQDTVCATNSAYTNHIDNLINLDVLVTGAPASLNQGGGNWRDLDGSGALSGADFTGQSSFAGQHYRFEYEVPGSSAQGACGPKADTISVFVSDCFQSISGTIWEDMNADGIRDAGESGSLGVLIQLFDANGIFVASMNTDTDGGYLFDGIPEGGYYVDIRILPNSYIHSPMSSGANPAQDSDIDPNTGRSPLITITANSGARTIDAGIFPNWVLSAGQAYLRANILNPHAALLSWDIPEIPDLKSFVIEKSASSESGTFEKVGAKNYEKENPSLEFIDHNAGADIQYYRLKLEGIEGHIGYSNVVELMQKRVRNEAIVYPNPANNYIYISLPDSDITGITILDVNGKHIRSEAFEPGQIQRVNVFDLKNGKYILKIINVEGILLSKKITIVH